MINVEFPADDNDDGDEDDDGSGGEKNASPRDGSVDGSHFEFDFTLLNRAGKRYHFSQNEQRDIQEINIPRHTAEYLPKWVGVISLAVRSPNVKNSTHVLERLARLVKLNRCLFVARECGRNFSVLVECVLVCIMIVIQKLNNK